MTDLTFLVAFAAGVLSFLSPCVLPLVPGYLGRLTVLAVAGAPGGAYGAGATLSGDARGAGAIVGAGVGAAAPSRWLAVRHAAAYVIGFGVVFTLLGVTASYIGAGLGPVLGGLRRVGGVVLIVMGLNLAGVLSVARLQGAWRPFDAGAGRQLASATGGIALHAPGDMRPGLADRLGGRLVGSGRGLPASFGLGVIFAIGWTPCIGTILGGILTLAATSGSTAQSAILLAGYTLGLGIPFLAIALVYDRAPAILRPLQRHGQAVARIGGGLVVVIGLAMLFDLLWLLPRYFTFLSAI